MTERLGGTVLYVDDNEVNRHAFSWLLRRAGFDVREAATGGEALRLVADRPDLVVLDVNLPDINGFEVCRRIKAHPATAAIPVLHLSAVYVRPEDRRHGLEEGADAYLTKPLEPADLIAQAKALLRGRQAEERARAAARQWQATFDALDDGVGLLDRDGRVLRCNRALPRLLGKPPGQVLGRTAHELTPAPPARGEASALLRMVATRRQVAEFPLGGRWLRATADPILGPDGGLAGAVYILSDVTESRRLKEQLRDSRKREALARLAGGSVHDFNQLVTAITANVSVLLAGAPGQGPDRAALRAVEQAAWRAAELARQLLGPALQGAGLPVPASPRWRAGQGSPALAGCEAPEPADLDRGSPAGAPVGGPGSPVMSPAPGPAAEPGTGAESDPDPGWCCRSGLTKAEAEELLDCLEANGRTQRELGYEDGKGFFVRWQAH
jgi:PAS domain S-box-containing protein